MTLRTTPKMLSMTSAPRAVKCIDTSQRREFETIQKRLGENGFAVELDTVSDYTPVLCARGGVASNPSQDTSVASYLMLFYVVRLSAIARHLPYMTNADPRYFDTMRMGAHKTYIGGLN
ncbi:hypothetical protein PSPO01_14842 [Paraphaeosphaeria sporulosa]